MRLLELHILQSFPVSCLNRDDVGAPKSAIFGGCMRARISSQCLKRAIREMARQSLPAFFSSNRSRLIVKPLKDILVQDHGIDEAKALDAAKAVGEYLATFDADKEDDGKLQVKTLMFLSPAEVAAIGKAMAALVKNMQPTTEEAAEKKGKKAKKGGDLADLAKQACKEACQEIALKDAADIAIFGRMVASDHTLTVEGAGMFGHALSTHKCENEIDFFSAVDDLKAADAEDAGAGHTGPIEFVAPCYYRYAALNLDLLYYQPQPPANLACLAGEAHAAERKAIVEAFIRATVQAVPNARKNSMNAHTFPAYVLGIVKDQGQPLQLVNAFEKPVCGRTGLVEPSVKAMLAHHAEMKKTWAIEPVEEVAIPDVTLPEFCQRLVAHVV